MMLSILVLTLACAAPQAAGAKPAPAVQKVELTDKEKADLKKQRDLADAFMRRAAELAFKKLDGDPKQARGKEKEARLVLEKRLAKKRQFDSGTETEELAEFQRQVREANQLDVKLTNQALAELLKASVLHLLNDKEIRQLEEEVSKATTGTTAEDVRRALSAEFRAKIVRELAAKKKKTS
jgi:hypothetical protein